MGRMSLIIVMGFMIISGIIFQMIFNSDLESVESTAIAANTISRDFTTRDFIDYAIERKVEHGEDHISSEWFGCQVEADINPVSPAPTPPLKRVKIEGTSYKDGEIKRINAVVLYRDIPMPIKTTSPFSCHSANVKLNLIGPSEINGYDVNMDGTLGDGDTVPGISLGQIDTSALISALMTDSTFFKVKGAGGTPSVGIDPNNFDDHTVQEYAELYASFADVTINDGVLPSGEYGTPDNPQIVHLDGNTVLEGNVQGSGLLVIDGDFSTTDTSRINWDGMIIANANADSSNLTLHMADSSSVTGSVIVDAPDKTNLNMVGQKVEFDIIGNEVIPAEDYNLTIRVLGSELAYHDGTRDVTTKLQVKIGGELKQQWDNVAFAEQDADQNGGYHRDGWDIHYGNPYQPPPSAYIWQPEETFAAGQPVSIICEFTNGGNIAGQPITPSNTNHAITLRNGDAAPDMSGAGSQASAEDFVAGYITDGTVTLNDNQAIYLFEGNTSNKDFQDCVVLADLAVPEEEEPDTIDIVTGQDSYDKTVKFQYSEEAYQMVLSLIQSKIGNVGKSIVQIDWEDENEIVIKD